MRRNGGWVLSGNGDGSGWHRRDLIPWGGWKVDGRRRLSGGRGGSWEAVALSEPGGLGHKRRSDPGRVHEC